MPLRAKKSFMKNQKKQKDAERLYKTRISKQPIITHPEVNGEEQTENYERTVGHVWTNTMVNE